MSLNAMKTPIMTLMSQILQPAAKPVNARSARDISDASPALQPDIIIETGFSSIDADGFFREEDGFFRQEAMRKGHEIRVDSDTRNL